MSALVERQGFPLPRGVSPEVEVFAIGDVHGRADLLSALIDEAAREPKQRQRRAIVFLGDLVDRGPDSLGAIDLAIGAAARIGADEDIALMGNHEAMMRLALDPETPWSEALDSLVTWTANGGDRTIAEFVEVDKAADNLDGLLAAARASLPSHVRDWLASLRVSWRSGDILFVHAGVNPRMKLDAFLAAPWNTPLTRLNEERHWAWVRWPFLEYRPGRKGFSGFFVVHGHTPNDAKDDASHEDQIKRFRLNLDAGSGLTGVVKMAIIRGAQAQVVAASGPTNWELRNDAW
jgi:serine/threonine protein phosphatase 1